jgi:hypothetical protein
MTKINSILGRNQQRNGRIHWHKTLAAVCAAVLLLAGITCAASEPIRTRLANAFLGRQEQLVMADFDADHDENKVILRIPGYLPDGFRLTQRLDGEQSISLNYEDGSRNAIYFSRSEYSDDGRAEMGWKEDAYTTEEITFCGLAGIFLKPVTGDVRPAVTFTDGNCLYIVETTLGRKELLKIAEGLAVEKVMVLKSPAWLPAGYTERSRTEFLTWNTEISYQNAAGKNVYFRRESLNTPAVRINDAVYFDTAPILVCGREGFLLSRRDGDSELRIRWSDDDFRYTVFGRISGQELLNIAENVK